MAPRQTGAQREAHAHARDRIRQARRLAREPSLLAVAEVGPGRARVWRLYMAAAAVGFEHDDNQVHQVLATATADGRSGMPLRPNFT